MNETLVDGAEVRRIAKLARLALSDDEVERLRGELGAILGYVAKMGELDLRGVPPTAHASDLLGPTRPDRAVPSYERDLALANAPQAQDGCFRVPAIL